MSKQGKKAKASNKQNSSSSFFIILIILISLIFSIFYLIRNNLEYRSRAQIQDPSSIKLRTLTIPPISISITYPPTAAYQPAVQITSGLITGGPVARDAPYYCIDDEDPDGCDDQTAFWVPKGIGGVSGTCGTVIEWAHRLVASLPDPQQFLKAMRNSLNPAVSSPGCNYTTGPYQSPDYISTYFIIDAYNLAGYRELSKSYPPHAVGADLMNWWKSSTAASAGYTFIPYSSSVLQQHSSGQRDLTGCVMFLNVPSGVSPGIVNYFELVNQNGDGVISILQAGARFMLDRFIVAGWDIQNTPQHQTVISGVAGFGCH